MQAVTQENNKTWVFDRWRLYVAFELQGWRWNLRYTHWGWEVSDYADFREDAIIEALDMADRIEHDGEFRLSYSFIVNGEKCRWDFHPNELVDHVLYCAISRTKQLEMDKHRWEIRTEEGFLCDPTHPIQIYKSDKPLNVSLKAGIGA
jgi:hypothetical protein